MKITDQVAAEKTFAEALKNAEERAKISGFDQHIVRSEGGSYWVLDDGDGTPPEDFADRLERTIREPRHGTY